MRLASDEFFCFNSANSLRSYSVSAMLSRDRSLYLVNSYFYSLTSFRSCRYLFRVFSVSSNLSWIHSMCSLSYCSILMWLRTSASYCCSCCSYSVLSCSRADSRMDCSPCRLSSPFMFIRISTEDLIYSTIVKGSTSFSFCRSAPSAFSSYWSICVQ